MDAVSFEEANLVSVLANGWEPGGLLIRGLRVLEGRALEPGDGRSVMLGRVLALNLGKKVGDDRLDRGRAVPGRRRSTRATACSRTAASSSPSASSSA